MGYMGWCIHGVVGGGLHGVCVVVGTCGGGICGVVGYVKKFPEKLRWPWNEQVWQGVKCKAL